MRGCVETTVRLNAAGPNKVRKSKESRVIPAGSLSVQVLIKALFTDVVCFPQCLTAVLETKTTTPRAEKAVFRNTTVTLGLYLKTKRASVCFSNGSKSLSQSFV